MKGKLKITLYRGSPIYKQEVNIEIVGGSKAERDRALTMAENAVLNGWMCEIEDTEEEAGEDEAD